MTEPQEPRHDQEPDLLDAPAPARQTNEQRWSAAWERFGSVDGAESAAPALETPPPAPPIEPARSSEPPRHREPVPAEASAYREPPPAPAQATAGVYLELAAAVADGFALSR